MKAIIEGRDKHGVIVRVLDTGRRLFVKHSDVTALSYGGPDYGTVNIPEYVLEAKGVI